MLNQKNGNATVMILGGVLVAGIGLYYLTNQIPQIQKIEKHSDEIVTYQSALNSILSYTVHAIRERWCLTANLMQRDCDSKLEDWALDSRNTARLLISDSRLSDDQFLQDYRQGKHDKDEALKLGTEQNPFKISVSLSEITSRHPLYVATETLRDKSQYDSIGLEVSRVNNINYPTGGDEIFLRIRSCLHSRLSIGDLAKKIVGNSVLGRGRAPFAESVVGFFPREIDSFALVVAGDLRLDRPISLSGVGDFQVPTIKDKMDLPKDGGLMFNSPVYVNGNVVLPTSLAEGGSGEYNPTTFADRIIVGDGAVLKSKNGMMVPVEPPNAGGLGQEYYAELSNQFGGFQQGVVREGSRDRGLDFLFRLKQGISPDRKLMAECIDRNQAQTDLGFTADSALVVRAVGPLTAMNDGSFQYQIALTKKNLFVEQSRILSSNVMSDKPSDVKAELKQELFPVALLSIELGSAKVQATIAKDAELTLTLGPFGSDGRALAGEPSQVVIQTNEVNVNGNVQPNSMNMKVSFKNAATLPTLKLNIKAYEVGSDGQGGLRQFRMLSNEAGLLFTKKDGNLIEPPAFSNTSDWMTMNPQGNQKINQYLSEGDATELERKCTSVVSESAVDSDFAPYARSSWLFAPIRSSEIYQFELAQFDAATPTERFDQTAAAIKQMMGTEATASIVNQIVSAVVSRDFGTYGDINISYESPLGYFQRSRDLTTELLMKGPGYQKAALAADIKKSQDFRWPVYTMIVDSSMEQIQGTCTIDSTADFVTGFYVCDKLVINARTKPLRIIGSFIVGSTNIDSSAIQSGIRWSSIFNRQAVEELREVGILGNGSACEFAVPGWQPASPEITARRLSCSSGSLRIADPFRWTMVDPDCALFGGKPAATICKRMPKRYTVKTINGGGNI